MPPLHQRGNKDSAQAGARLAPAWRPWSSWLASWAPHEVPRLDLSASSRASLTRPCLRKPPVVRPARLGPSRGWAALGPQLSHATGRRQVSLGTPIPTTPIAWKPSPSAPWAQGLLSASWTWGYPVLPACGPPCDFIDGLVRPSFETNTTRPSQGAKPCGVDDAKTPEGVGLLRRAPEGRRDLCSYLMRIS